ncbi:hypothetical protein B0A50_00482 [Salinomyces thailandicus]|uniref:Uncharacterized protein n=1 Tax=Salinomyces thailandicus TaxID=706561 RepID=A0A4U0UG68_9PEZI|nr:hypothetical protein B0A50_00482 [Salinomyces thailandica]
MFPHLQPLRSSPPGTQHFAQRTTLPSYEVFTTSAPASASAPFPEISPTKTLVQGSSTPASSAASPGRGEVRNRSPVEAVFNQSLDGNSRGRGARGGDDGGSESENLELEDKDKDKDKDNERGGSCGDSGKAGFESLGTCGRERRRGA